MSEPTGVSPGTVSRILWHFTGGPTWNAKTKRQNKAPKKASEAYDSLRAILRSNVLRLGKYREVARIIVPERRRFDATTNKVKLTKNAPIEIESSPICCLSDIPAAHLRYHAYRYGRFAVGFHRDRVIGAGFNPVFYTLEDTPIVRSIYEGFSSLDGAEPDAIQSATAVIDSLTSDLQAEHTDIDFDLSAEIGELEAEAESLTEVFARTRNSLNDLVAFVKTFSRDEFSTVYCEREWRSTREYRFRTDDIAMIVLPKRIGSVEYFKKFVQSALTTLKLPRTIPVVPWDDLVEH